jgi:peptidyl-dipeptidase A
MDMDREGDVRVLANVRSDERWMSTMLHEFGHAVYDKYNDRELPFSLREPAHILTTEAIAMLNGRMTRSPSWLVRFAGVSPTAADRLGAEIFQGSRAGMLIFLRWALTLVRFERELYRDPRQPLNAVWWELAARIQKISPPPGRDRPDWASKIHLSTNPVYYQNYILGELMASQVQDAIESGASGAEDIFTPGAGEYLIEKIFKPGTRWHWNEMLERATGEKLAARHFLDQFQISGSAG